MKTRVVRIIGLAVGLVVLACILACGGLQQAAMKSKTRNDLAQLGIFYHNYHDAKNKGPANVQEFGEIVKGDPVGLGLVSQTTPGGKYVMFWNVRLSGLTQGTVNTVLGYEASVPANGGFVLMADGSVRQMTAAEFAAAPEPDKDGKN